jgi:hypothetical protein
MRHNRLVLIRQLIDAALADPGPLSVTGYTHLTVAKTSIVEVVAAAHQEAA